MTLTQGRGTRSVSGGGSRLSVRPLKHPWYADVSKLAAIAFACFLLAGKFKASFSLPVDLTVLTGGITGLFLAREFLRVRSMVSPRILILVLLFTTFALVEFTSQHTSNYAEAKVTNLFLLNGLAAFAPFIIIRTSTQRRQFLFALTVLAMIMAANVVTQTILGQEFGRITGFADGPIGPARVINIALVTVMAGFMTRALKPSHALLLLGFLGSGALATGSRGPLIAATVAIVVMGLISLRRGSSRGQIIFSLLALGIAFVISTNFTNETQLQRFEALTEGDIRTSGETRLVYYDVSLSEVFDSPTGLGWGGFQDLTGGDSTYAHNLLIELFLEGGWITGFASIAVIVTTFVIARIQPGELTYERLAIMGLFVYMLVGSMFSGDINGNRPLFAIIGILLARDVTETPIRLRRGGPRPAREKPRQFAWAR